MLVVGRNSGLGDRVDDTPPQSEATSGCPSPAPDTCPGDGEADAINNYMDFSNNACTDRFTAGVRRKLQLVQNYQQRLNLGTIVSHIFLS